MTEAQAVELICARFVSTWPTASGGVPFGLPDEPKLAVEEFAMLEIAHATREQITQGPNPRRESRGAILIRLWTPAGVGRARLAALCDIARTVYEGQSLSLSPAEPITIKDGATQPAGTDGRWTMAYVRFPFRYYS